METLWIDEGNFVSYIHAAGDKATLENIDGFNRWIITGENGVKYIVRPKPQDEHANPTEMSQ